MEVIVGLGIAGWLCLIVATSQNKGDIKLEPVLGVLVTLILLQGVALEVEWLNHWEALASAGVYLAYWVTKA